jgi:Conjugative transposon protein TcpC
MPAVRNRVGREVAGPRTARALLATVGRVVLWLAVALVVVRGAGDVVRGQRPAATRHAQAEASRRAWPDDAARAFAVQFATAFLDRGGVDDPDVYARSLAVFASPEVADALAPRVDGHKARQAVHSLAVAGVTALDARHALVTVAATVAGTESRVVRLTVPVARDARGGLAVYDLPSLAPAPPRAAAGPAAGEPLLGSERAAITDVLTRFFGAYLAGDAGGLAYLVPAGTRIGAVTGGFELVEVGSVAAAGPPSRGGRVVLATLEARDRVSRAVLGLRYRVRLVRRDRWYVAALDGAGRHG